MDGSEAEREAGVRFARHSLRLRSGQDTAVVPTWFKIKSSRFGESFSGGGTFGRGARGPKNQPQGLKSRGSYGFDAAPKGRSYTVSCDWVYKSPLLPQKTRQKWGTHETLRLTSVAVADRRSSRALRCCWRAA